MNLLSHALFSLALGSVLTLEIGWVVLGGILPDIDYLLGIEHRAATHSLIFISALSFFVYKRDKRKGISLFIGLIDHLVLDIITIGGVEILWPLRYRFSIPLIESMDPKMNLLLSVISITVFINSRTLSLRLANLDPRKIRIATFALLFIPIFASISISIYQDSKCVSIPIEEMVSNPTFYEDRCVITEGKVCSNKTTYIARSNNVYNMFHICNNDSQILIFMSSEYNESVEVGDMVVVTGFFTTKYKKYGYEINRIKDIRTE